MQNHSEKTDYSHNSRCHKHLQEIIVRIVKYGAEFCDHIVIPRVDKIIKAAQPAAEQLIQKGKVQKTSARPNPYVPSSAAHRIV